MNVGATVGRVWASVRSGWGLYLVAAVLSRVGGIVLVPLYTRRLSPAEYGGYSLIVSLIALLPLLLTLGLTAVISKVYFDSPDASAARERVGTVARGLFAAAAFGGLVLSLAALVLWPPGWLGAEPRSVAITVIGGVGTAFTAVPEAWFRASRQARKAVALQLVTFFSTTGLGVLFVAGLGRGLAGAVEAIALVGIGNGLFALVFVSRLGGRFEPGVVTRWLPVSLPFVLHFAASWLLSMGDRWVLSTSNLSEALGPYYLAIQVVSPAPMLVATWNELDAARLGEEYRDRGIAVARAGAPRRAVRYLLVALAGALAVGAIVPVLPWVVGAKFLGAVAFVPALLLAHLLESQYFVPANLLLYAGRTASIPAITVTAGLLNVVLAYVLLPTFGVTALLIARVVASLTRSALMALTARALVRGPGDGLKGVQA